MDMFAWTLTDTDDQRKYIHGDRGIGRLMDHPHWHALVTQNPQGDVVMSGKRLIIGTGFGKTGTSSLAVALRILGYERTVHWTPELFLHAGGTSWSATDWLRFESVDAVLDFPTPEYTLELVKIFPNSLVILTWREEESWLRSHMHHFHTGTKEILEEPQLTDKDGNACLAHLAQLVRNTCGLLASWKLEHARDSSAGMSTLLGAIEECPILSARFLSFGTLCPSRAQALKRMLLHTATLQREVPSERLLLMNIERGEGWTHLCPFLGMKENCTSAEFPFENASFIPPSVH